MKEVFPLKIVSPEKEVFSGDAVMLSVMGESGSLSVMAGHIPFVTPVRDGDVRVYEENKTTEYSLSGRGLLTVGRDRTVLLVDGRIELK